MSVQTMHFNDTFITNEPLKIELIDIAEPSDLIEIVLNVLLDVYNEKGSFAYTAKLPISLHYMIMGR